MPKNNMFPEKAMRAAAQLLVQHLNVGVTNRLFTYQLTLRAVINTVICY